MTRVRQRDRLGHLIEQIDDGSATQSKGLRVHALLQARHGSAQVQNDFHFFLEAGLSDALPRAEVQERILPGEREHLRQ